MAAGKTVVSAPTGRLASARVGSGWNSGVTTTPHFPGAVERLDMTTWGELFDRAEEYETSVEAIRDRLEARRTERADRPTETGKPTGPDRPDGERSGTGDPNREP